MYRHVFHVFLKMGLVFTLLLGCAGIHSLDQASCQLDPVKVPNPFHRLIAVDAVKPHVCAKMLSAAPLDDVMLIDSRPKQPRYDKGHIPTAVSLPDSQFEKMAADVLPADKNTKLIFYCGGAECPLSHQSAWMAEALGYVNVHVYSGGDPEWVAKGYTLWTAEGPEMLADPVPAALDLPQKSLKAGPAEGTIDNNYFIQLMREKPGSILLIDVRSGQEFAAGHIPGAVNMTVDMLEEKITAFNAEKPIVFICSTGARSGEAFYVFMEMRPDLREVYYLDANVKYGQDGIFSLQ